jgi:transcriptional regulator with XRE-family HTH domain
MSGKELRKKLKKEGFLHMDFAELLGVSASTLERILKAKEISRLHLNAIKTVFREYCV